MSQSAYLVGALLAAFVLYLAARGRLNTYAGVLFGAAPSSGSTSGGGGGLLGTIGKVVGVAKTVGQVAEVAGAA